MIEYVLLYSILAWHGMWWPLYCIALPCNLLQMGLNKWFHGKWITNLKVV